MSEFKNAVVVGKVTLAPRKVIEIKSSKPVTVAKVQEIKKEFNKQVRRADRPEDARTANTTQLAELQHLKKQIRTLQEQLAEANGKVSTLAAQLAKATTPSA